MDKTLLLRKHCEEYKALLAEELKARIDLGTRHRREISEFKTCYFKIASLIYQHSVEIFEYQVNKQERMAILADQHARELLDNAQ